MSHELRTARFARLLGRPDRTLSAPFPSGTRPAFLTIRAALQFLCICLIVWIAGVSEASSATRHVVLLFDERPELPGLAMLEAEFTRTLASNSADRVEIYREELDLSRFGSLTYQARLPDLLKTKYADKKIDAVVAVLGPSLEFLLNYGAEIFPGVPIVFCGIDRRELNDRPLPSNVRGILVKRQFAPTLEIALKIHPGTERVVVVAGTSEFDTRLLNQAREEFRAYENRVAFTYLTTLSLPNLLTEVSRLPPRTIVLFTTLFQDGGGESFVTHDVAERISATANAPVYGFLDQYLGRGIVGGSLYSLAAQGAEAAKLVAQILTGAKSSEPTLLEVPANLLLFDWRQLQRWGISKASLPANSEIRFRNPTLWDQYRWHLLIGLTVLLAEGAIILGLVVERHRRRAAERVSRSRTLEAIHLNRTATVSALSGSVAHELSQPLSAILNYAGAAAAYLSQDPLNLARLKDIVDAIQHSGIFATQTISHLRSLLRKTDEMDLREVDLGDVIDAALDILQFESAKQGVSISVQKCGPSTIRGDHVHLQQVVLNLVVNAMDAMSSSALGEKKLEICTFIRNETEIEISVSDTGTGIPEGQIKEIFQTFRTTKEEGTGIGLSISRAIVENHGGKIWAENGKDRGAIFKFTLPLASSSTHGTR